MNVKSNRKTFTVQYNLKLRFSFLFFCFFFLLLQITEKTQGMSLPMRMKNIPRQMKQKNNTRRRTWILNRCRTTNGKMQNKNQRDRLLLDCACFCFRFSVGDGFMMMKFAHIIHTHLHLFQLASEIYWILTAFSIRYLVYIAILCLILKHIIFFNSHSLSLSLPVGLPSLFH